MKLKLIWMAILLCMVLAQSALLAQNWQQFRGAKSNCLPEVNKLPTEWDSTNIVWKMKIPGKGWSSPILWEDKVFVTTAVFV